MLVSVKKGGQRFMVFVQRLWKKCGTAALKASAALR
jgi:hypothetical protein